MGLYDTVVILDDVSGAVCPAGHAVRALQTKDLDEPSMSTYLVRGGGLYRAEPHPDAGAYDDAAAGWRIDGDSAVSERRFDLRAAAAPRSVRVYSQCRICEPVLVRNDGGSFLGDIVTEHALFVDLTLTFRPGEPVQVERTSGGRRELQAELCARGLVVLGDDEPLAVAHREVQKARQRSGRRDDRW